MSLFNLEVSWISPIVMAIVNVYILNVVQIFSFFLGKKLTFVIRYNKNILKLLF